MTENQGKPTLGVITPVYNEADNLAAYFEEVRKHVLSLDDVDTSVLLVDDGSNDESWAMIRELCAEDSRFSAIRLSRNFGAHRALSAGLANIDADAVVILPADLQEPPETVAEFVAAWQGGADIVWGVRKSRQDQPWRVWTSNLLRWLLRRYAMPKGSQFTTGAFMLIDRRVHEAVQQFNEANRITFAIVAWTGFEQTQVLYDRRARFAGKSKWGFSQLIKAMYDAFIGFSSLPIRLMEFAAVASFVLASALVVYLLAVAIGGSPLPGWTSQMLIVSVFFGIQFWLLAVLGEYLSRIYSEVVRRPLFFISETTDPGGGRDMRRRRPGP